MLAVCWERAAQRDQAATVVPNLQAKTSFTNHIWFFTTVYPLYTK